ncbi:alpha/beta-hydrolase [Xylariomycetidae sp. FL2044]|nr:alpha/beta-hydrolase [Xylariomycetidae sp. FL2044]
MGLAKTPTELFFTLSDSRVLCYAVYGDPSSKRTVFFHHGMPGSHIEAAQYHEGARQRGLRLLAVERPGYGDSTYQPDRRILDWPSDLLALAEHLQIDRFAVIGLSGGGPYALACLYGIPRARCVGACVVAGMWPASFGLSGMMLQNRVLFRCASWSPWLMEKIFDVSFGSAARDHEHPERFDDLNRNMIRSKPAADRTAWERDERVQEILIEDSRRSVQHGCKGMAREAVLFSTDWGFQLQDIRVDRGELVAWHGALDVNVPVAMAKKASALIEGVELRIDESASHFTLLAGSKIEEVMNEVNWMLS